MHHLFLFEQHLLKARYYKPVFVGRTVPIFDLHINIYFPHAANCDYLHVDNGGNCTPLSLHSRTIRAFTFRQISNTLETK